MQRTLIKICGLTNAADAQAAAAAGADACGVVLAPSRRGVSLEQAQQVLGGLDQQVVRVGVFVNPSVAFVAEAVVRLGLGAVQLSGDESPLFVRELSEAQQVDAALWPDTLRPDARRPEAHVRPEALPHTGRVRIIKALRVGTGFDARCVLPFLPFVSAILLDACAEGLYGGSGRTFDWERVSAIPRSAPLILAGGLTPENVARAVACVRPAAVDVASGVESAPGIKDHDKIKAFVAAVREVTGDLVPHALGNPANALCPGGGAQPNAAGTAPADTGRGVR